MKVAIVYDRVNKFGGAERVLLTLHEMFPKAPLYTSVYSKENAKWAEVFDIKTSFLNKIKFLQDKHEFLAPLMPFVFSRFNFDEYDLVISVTSEFAKNINVKNKHICYCLTPTRYLWSHYDEYFHKLLRFAVGPLIWVLRNIDQKAAKKPNEMIAISTEVQRRIKKYYKRDAKIIFPPVDKLRSHKNFENLRTNRSHLETRSFGPRKGVASHSFRADAHYYLIVSRLVKYKKVDLAVETFNELELPLVIVGTGREETKLKRQAKSNIKFLGKVNDIELAKIYKNAKALIFPQEEDFGIVAVEAQSYGLPVIAYKKGGVLDIISKKTGVFFVEQNKKQLIKSIREFESRKFNKTLLKQNSRKFSEKRFKHEFLKFMKNM